MGHTEAGDILLQLGMAVTTQQEYGVVFFLPIETFGVDVMSGHRFVLFAFWANFTHQRLVCIHLSSPLVR